MFQDFFYSVLCRNFIIYKNNNKYYKYTKDFKDVSFHK